MRAELSQGQIDRYRDEGFLVVDALYDERELNLWRSAVDAAVERRLSAVRKAATTLSRPTRLVARLKQLLGSRVVSLLGRMARAALGDRLVPVGFNGVHQSFTGLLGTNQGDAARYYAQVYLQCVLLAAESTVVRALACDPRLGRMAGQLSGASGVRLYHDQALIKPAFGNSTALHLDNQFWSFDSAQAMTMWIALDDATLANGCMWYLPGSQKTELRAATTAIGDSFASLLDVYPEWREIEPTPCPMRAGSVVFHNGRIAHGAGVNLTTRPRRAFALGFMPEGSRFNGRQDVLPDDYFRRLAPDALLDDDQVHPLLWTSRAA